MTFYKNVISKFGKERSEAKGLAVIGEDITVEAGRVIADGEMIGSASKNN